MKEPFAENKPQLTRKTPQPNLPSIPGPVNVVPIETGRPLKPDIIILNSERGYNIPPEFWLGLLNGLLTLFGMLVQGCFWVVRNLVIVIGLIIYYILIGLSLVVAFIVENSGGSLTPFVRTNRNNRPDNSGQRSGGNNGSPINVNVNINSNQNIS